MCGNALIDLSNLPGSERCVSHEKLKYVKLLCQYRNVNEIRNYASGTCLLEKVSRFGSGCPRQQHCYKTSLTNDQCSKFYPNQKLSDEVRKLTTKVERQDTIIGHLLHQGQQTVNQKGDMNTVYLTQANVYTLTN